ncbi:group II truncated hemoglobin [Vulgatibacter sp.]|uniref:group II truncated hemoglobin n=1 Tax=Vulgatibacter sp. TaxID=1971226 RepID=UPI0035647EC2
MSAWQPAAGETPFEILGGAETIRVLVERFYDAMERDEPALAALHKQDEPGKVSRESRDKFASFLCFWLGGPRTYLETRGHPMLRARHAPFVVDEAMRDAWLRSMITAMDEVGIAGEVRTFLDGRFAHVADFLRNVEG